MPCNNSSFETHCYFDDSTFFLFRHIESLFLPIILALRWPTTRLRPNCWKTRKGVVEIEQWHYNISSKNKVRSSVVYYFSNPCDIYLHTYTYISALRTGPAWELQRKPVPSSRTSIGWMMIYIWLITLVVLYYYYFLCSLYFSLGLVIVFKLLFLLSYCFASCVHW